MVFAIWEVLSALMDLVLWRIVTDGMLYFGAYWVYVPSYRRFVCCIFWQKRVEPNIVKPNMHEIHPKIHL